MLSKIDKNLENVRRAPRAQECLIAGKAIIGAEEAEAERVVMYCRGTKRVRILSIEAWRAWEDWSMEAWEHECTGIWEPGSSQVCLGRL